MSARKPTSHTRSDTASRRTRASRTAAPIRSEPQHKVLNIRLPWLEQTRRQPPPQLAPRPVLYAPEPIGERPGPRVSCARN